MKFDLKINIENCLTFSSQNEERSWALIFNDFGCLEAILDHFGHAWGTLGALSGALGTLWGAFWDAPGKSWTPLGRNVRKNGLVPVFWSPIWNPFGDLLAPKRFQNQVDTNVAFSTHFLSLFSSKLTATCVDRTRWSMQVASGAP